ncbi:hypothetical protein Xmau_02990 [Xenorhabdus mauleonii]|uniref:Uncharacterized protein n=1 Tax=Xenorhabdus mauleonii TaxID=351675 RepID=A0A1I3S9Z9_9GAMM|nr:hypothetical protein Xmau_02990 [Xenorhabdus mauleonii]SFJ54822.1 hypothetical protein SAMN05421680_11111 [Xenorhabdus mauleonii]
MCGQGHELLAYCLHTHGQYAQDVWLKGAICASYETRYPTMMLQMIEQALGQAGMCASAAIIFCLITFFPGKLLRCRCCAAVI